MKYCSECGHKGTWQVVEGDDRPRFVCGVCRTIHYENPRMVVGAIPERTGTILLCRRAIEPCRGKWTLPAGYLENGETIAECARREAREEAVAELENLRPYALINIPFINQVYFIYLSHLVNRDFRAGSESLEVKLFRIADIPWDELAFRVVHDVLRSYCSDLQADKFPFRIMDISPLSAKNSL